MSGREERDARGAQARLRGASLPAADPAFRERLRAAFADGSLARAAAGRPERADVPAVPFTGPAPVLARRPLARRPAAWLGGLAAAAAVATIVLVGFNPGPHWQVASLQRAHGNVLVDDDAVPADDAASLTDALIAGARIEWNGEGDLMLLSPGQLALSIAPGSRLTLPAPPPRFWGRVSRARLETGRVRLTTGPDFHGARALVVTPEAMAEVTGTTLAVIRDPMGTCVCVSEGRVHVMRAARGAGGAGGQDLGMVPAGQRQVVYRTAQAPERTPILPTEKEPLAALRADMHARWHEPSPAH